MKRLTMKFGGTSMGSADAMVKAASIVVHSREIWDQVLIVVSAMSEVTDLLLRASHRDVSSNGTELKVIRDKLWTRHESVADRLILDLSRRKQLYSELEGLLDTFTQSCQAISQHEQSDGRLLDIVASLGERCSARLFAAVLQEAGLDSVAMDATELIITDDRFQAAVPNMSLTHQRVENVLLPNLRDDIVPVVTGFIGSTETGEVTTLGRGGSDYSAAILGACVDTDELWIWTDVNGVLTADPGIVPRARSINHLSYHEVSELAYFGAKVVHPKTIQPLLDRKIPIWVRNTFNPSLPGTCIEHGPGKENGKIKAVTAIHDLSMITVEGRGMIGVPGIAARTFSAVAREGVSVMMISQASSEQSISFVVPMDKAKPVVQAVEEEMVIELERRDIDRISSLDDVVIVTAVGAGLRETPGIAANIFGALGSAQINVIAIAQGSSECGLSMVVHDLDALHAVRKIHDEVVLNG